MTDPNQPVGLITAINGKPVDAIEADEIRFKKGSRLQIDFAPGPKEAADAIG